MRPTYLALDQGGHASRALVFGHRGQLLAQASVPVATTHPGPDRVEQDPEQLVGSLRAAMDQALAGLPADARPLAAGLATQRSSLVCWDRRDGRALSPVLSWQDRRHAGWLATLAPRADEIRARTGLVLSPHYGASKLRWCLEQLPAVAAARDQGTLCMGPLASFLAFRLLAERPCVADPANAARTQLWNPATGDWDPELLALFGIPAHVLPRAVTSRYPYGQLATAAGPVPLTVVTGDQSAVPFAFGPLDADTAYVNVGTGAFVQRPIRQHLPQAPRLLVSVVWSEPGRVDYLLEGTVNGAGAALDWLAEREGMPVGDLLAAAATRPADAPDPPLFINGVGGLASPYWRSELAPAFVTGPRAADGPGDRALAVLESIVFLLVDNLRAMAADQAALQRVLLTGGLSAAPAVWRGLADLAGVPVWRAEDPEATARGLARLVAGPAGGGWPGFSGQPLLPADNARLAARHRRWRGALDQALGLSGLPPAGP